MKQYLIHNVHPNDAPVLSDLALKSKAYWGYDAQFLANCKTELTYTPEQINDNNWLFQSAQSEDHSILGFYALHFDSNKLVELIALFIDPNYIGQGIGKSLLNAARQQVSKQKLNKIIIHSDPNAEDFYLSQGATKIGDTPSQSIPGRQLPLLSIKL
ncbi:GNAT family N-acetyltransferase [Paraglaciecola sp.]|uniref:GNAT family N-acetyltransferase n=1 Tax=Paraglaciecola sp. TaxID=1920173 RepID=UPI003EF93A9F